MCAYVPKIVLGKLQPVRAHRADEKVSRLGVIGIVDAPLHRVAAVPVGGDVERVVHDNASDELHACRLVFQSN